MKKLENCNYAIEVAKKPEFSMVGIGGKELLDVNKKLILGILYQTMRVYTLVILQKCAASDKPIKDDEIIAWVNEKLVENQTRITSFKDASIASSRCVIDLIDGMKPGFIHYKMVSGWRKRRRKAVERQIRHLHGAKNWRQIVRAA